MQSEPNKIKHQIQELNEFHLQISLRLGILFSIGANRTDLENTLMNELLEMASDTRQKVDALNSMLHLAVNFAANEN